MIGFLLFQTCFKISKIFSYLFHLYFGYIFNDLGIKEFYMSSYPSSNSYYQKTLFKLMFFMNIIYSLMHLFVNPVMILVHLKNPRNMLIFSYSHLKTSYLLEYIENYIYHINLTSSQLYKLYINYKNGFGILASHQPPTIAQK